MRGRLRRRGARQLRLVMQLARAGFERGRTSRAAAATASSTAPASPVQPNPRRKANCTANSGSRSPVALMIFSTPR